MIYNDFEDYLGMEHAKEYHGVDDDMPDAFIEWLCELEPEEWLMLGDKYKLIN